MTASIEHATSLVDRLAAFDPAALPRTAGPEKFTLLAEHARAEAAVVAARAAEVQMLLAALHAPHPGLTTWERANIEARVRALLGLDRPASEPTA